MGEPAVVEERRRQQLGERPPQFRWTLSRITHQVLRLPRRQRKQWSSRVVHLANLISDCLPSSLLYSPTTYPSMLSDPSRISGLCEAHTSLSRAPPLNATGPMKRRPDLDAHTCRPR